MTGPLTSGLPTVPSLMLPVPEKRHGERPPVPGANPEVSRPYEPATVTGSVAVGVDTPLKTVGADAPDLASRLHSCDVLSHHPLPSLSPGSPSGPGTSLPIRPG